jgi:hypothetical protein
MVINAVNSSKVGCIQKLILRLRVRNGHQVSSMKRKEHLLPCGAHLGNRMTHT